MKQPYVEVLEGRRLFSLILFPPGRGIDGVSLLRTSGVAVQSGSLLTVVLEHKVGQPGLDTVKVVDDGKGDIQVNWDGGPVHSFSGVGQIVIDSMPTQTEQVTLQLNGPLVVPLGVQLNLTGKNNTVTEEVGDNGASPAGLDVSIDTLRHNGTTVVNVTP